MCVTICVGTLCYSFSFSNQTDQGDDTRRIEEGGIKDGEIERERLERKGVKRLFNV